MAITGYILAGSLLLGLLAAGSSFAADDPCYADWSTAAPLVKSEGLATVEELTARAARHLKGSIIKTQLCESGGRWYYRLVVREPGGQLRALTVDARQPFGE